VTKNVSGNEIFKAAAKWAFVSCHGA